MAKLPLNTIGSRYGSVDALNANFDAIEEAFDNTLSRDGSGPNAMESALDMNANPILNASTVYAGSIILGGQTLEAGAAVAAATVQIFEYTASAGQTTFSVAPLTPSAANILFEVNGVALPPSSIGTAGSSITVPALQLNDEVVIRVFTREIGAADPTTADNVSYTPTGVGAVSTTVQTKLREAISVKDFGAVGNGVVDDTAAIQAALNAASATLLNHKRVFIPAGVYSVSTLYIPVGIALEGETFIEGSDRAGTRLVQRTVGDVIRFTPIDNGGKLYWNGAIRRMAIFGNASLASGWGISFRNAAGATVAMQDLSLLEDLIIRRCPSGGVEIPNAGLPITFNRMKLLFNNGPGIHLTSVTSNQHQSVNFNDISGDGNNGGLIKLSGLDANGNVNIINLKSERRVNSDYGSVDMQENAIVTNGCNGTPINVIGATHISSVPDGGGFSKKPGSLIKILDNNFPCITWNGVGIRVRGTDTGPDPYIIEDATNIAIPKEISSGRFGNVSVAHVTQSGEHKMTFGNVSSYQADSGEDNAFQVAGTTPGLSLYETDVAADNRAWLVAVASGGNLTQRYVTDAGVSTIFRTTTRTAGVVTKDVWAVPVGVPSYTVATLPSPGLGAALIVYVSNESGGATLAFSDGTNWRRVQDRAVVS